MDLVRHAINLYTYPGAIRPPKTTLQTSSALWTPACCSQSNHPGPSLASYRYRTNGLCYPELLHVIRMRNLSLTICREQRSITILMLRQKLRDWKQCATIIRRPNQASNARLLVNTQKLPADMSERPSNINAVPISVIMSYPLSANVQSAPNAAPFQVTPACIQVPQGKDTTRTANPTKKSDKHGRGNANHRKLEESQTDRSRSRSSNNSELHACRTLGINTLTANDYGNGNARQADSHHHNSCAHPVNRAPAGPWPYPLRVRALRGQIHRDQSTAKERVKRGAEKRQTCRTRPSLLVHVVDATNIDIQPSAPIVSASGSPTYPGIEDPEALKTWVARSLAERYGRESWP